MSGGSRKDAIGDSFTAQSEEETYLLSNFVNLVPSNDRLYINPF